VAVFSDVSEPAVLAALRAHQLDGYVDAVAARQGLDLAAEVGRTVERAANLLGVAPAACLAVSGSCPRLHAARSAGAIGLGCVCGRGKRKHLADPEIPVVSNLQHLSHALLLRSPEP
jgi:beta-phosphoglucomutase-like phosphatase (HAD superfamily)